MSRSPEDLAAENKRLREYVLKYERFRQAVRQVMDTVLEPKPAERLLAALHAIGSPLEGPKRDISVLDGQEITAYREGLLAGLAWGRKTAERILKENLASLEREYHPRNVPEGISRTPP